MTDDVRRLATDLRAAARRARQRRALVLAGDREAGLEAAFAALDAAEASPEAVTVLTDADDVRRRAARRAGWGGDAATLPPARADRLLGTTREAVVVDAHESFSPNVLGRVAGAVDGGGLLVLVVPPLDDWPDRRDAFDESLAVPPFDAGDVTGRFRRRLVETIRQHPGVAVVDVDSGAVASEGRADAPPGDTGWTPSVPRDAAFPRAAYEACVTADQSRAVRALEALRDPGRAVVVEADRGRGKSSAAGIAAGALAAEGRDVLVTAPAFRNAAEVFARARELLGDLGALSEPARGADGGGRDRGGATETAGDDRTLRSAAGGRVRYAPPVDAAALPGDPDAVVVDEAAALPVRVLERFLDAPAAAFCTTVHGYEGAGRGFSVRFSDRLDESALSVDRLRLDDPVRYARGDPVEAWAFRALLLDARPAVDEAVADATPETAEFRALSPDELLADEHLLREAFGLLVLAHYRTEPDDLARLLDAPNLAVRALVHEGRVASVALLAREGGLDAETRRHAYDGGRIRGNMLPDVLTSQLRDERAGVPVGYRVMRIATHHAVRSRGLGSRLLDDVSAEFEGDADWLGVGYGATPELLSFWDANGYDTVHLSTTRNDASGEYSALMLRPLSDRGRALRDRHRDRFLRRIGGVLSDPLSDLDPDVARAAVAAASGSVAPDLSAYEWRVVAGAAYGPGLADVAPAAFADLAVTALADADVGAAGATDPDDDAGAAGAGAPDADARADLTPREERLLVRKALQGHPWPAVADELGYHSTGHCMRSFGDAYQPLVDRYGAAAAREERDRYRDDERE